VPSQAVRPHAEANGKWAGVPVEEDQIEGEAHTEGVDAGAAGDQQAGPGPLAAKAGQPEETGAKAAGYRDLVAEDKAARQPRQAPRDRLLLHARSS
jgi:hypothetical protein